MSTKNHRTLGVRLDEHDNTRHAQYERETHDEGVSLARASLRAALDYFEANGSIILPLRITDAAKNTGQSHAQYSTMRAIASAHLQDSTPERPPIPVATAVSTITTHSNQPPPKTADIVRLPPPPALATAGRWSLNESPTPPPTEHRNETTYPKPPRKKNG